MLKLKKRITLRIPDQLAIATTLALMVTVAVAMPGNRLGFGGDAGTQSNTPPPPVRAEQADMSGESTAKDRGFKLRLLLIRRG